MASKIMGKLEEDRSCLIINMSKRHNLDWHVLIPYKGFLRKGHQNGTLSGVFVFMATQHPIHSEA